jgi:uncharacterized membrane protein
MKPWYTSKTVWAGILEILAAIGLVVADFLQAGDFTAPAFVLLGVGVLTIVMRFLTNAPIG